MDRRGQVWQIPDSMLTFLVVREPQPTGESNQQVRHETLILDPGGDEFFQAGSVGIVYEHAGNEVERRGWKRLA